MKPEPRASLPGYDSGTMTVLIVTFLLLALNFRHYSTFVKTFSKDLWSVRSRENLFDEPTVSETRVITSFVILATVCEGILAFAVANASGLRLSTPFITLTACIGAAIAYYLWQLLAYQTVGYAFGQPWQRIQWVKGFNASQALLGLAIMIPAIVVLFNPDAVTVAVALAIALYVVARIIFIIKGFRLFYQNLFSLLYFILYLCALEMLPLFALWKGGLSANIIH